MVRQYIPRVCLFPPLLVVLIRGRVHLKRKRVQGLEVQLVEPMMVMTIAMMMLMIHRRREEHIDSMQYHMHQEASMELVVVVVCAPFVHRMSMECRPDPQTVEGRMGVVATVVVVA